MADSPAIPEQNILSTDLCNQVQASSQLLSSDISMYTFIHKGKMFKEIKNAKLFSSKSSCSGHQLQEELNRFLGSAATHQPWPQGEDYEKTEKPFRMRQMGPVFSFEFSGGKKIDFKVEAIR